MSVAEQIGRLAQNLVASRNMVTQKNGTVGSAVAFDNLADEIMSITASQGEQVLVDDTDTAYRKSILNGAQKYAKLKSIGGMTYKCDNLIPFPYDGTKGAGHTTTHNGITFVVNGDGSVTCNGTATAKAVFNLLSVSYLSADTLYGNVTMSGCPKGGSTSTYYLYNLTTGHKDVGNDGGIVTAGFKGGYLRYAVIVESGTTVTNLVFKPMVNFGTTALPFEPYFEGLRDTKVTAIKSYGANLIPFPYYDGMNCSNQGITFIVDDDGVITVSGTYTGTVVLFDYRLADLIYLPAGDYTISGCEHGDNNVRIFAWIKGGKADRYESQFSGNLSFKLNEGEYIYRLTLRIAQAVGTINNEVIKPMINLGTTAAPYKPYREPITYNIPEALQGSGKGIEGYADTIDLERGMYIKRCETVTLNGNEVWQQYDASTGTLFFYTLLAVKGANQTDLICNNFTNTSGTGGFVISANNILRFYGMATYPTIDDWKAYLSKQYASGNPVTITYALAEPIETDLAETIGNIIEVEAGGFLEFVNEHGNAMPSHISYLRRL